MQSRRARRAQLSGMAALTLLFGLAGGLASGAGAADAPRLYQESYAREQMGDYAGALESLTRVPEADRVSYFHSLRLGWLRYLNGDHDASISAYRQAVERAPEAVEPYLGLLLPLMARRSWPEAERTALAALERDPKSYLATSRLAWILFSQGRYRDAEPRYRALVALYPGDLEMRAGLAWSLARLGRRAEAEQVFQAILAVAPGHPSARSGLDELRRATGR